MKYTDAPNQSSATIYSKIHVTTRTSYSDVIPCVTFPLVFALTHRALQHHQCIYIYTFIYIYHGKPQRESNPCPWVCVDVGESSGSRSLFLTASSLPLPLSLTLNSFFNTAPRSFLSSVHALNRAVHLQHPPLHTYMSDVWHHFFALTQSSGGRPHQQMKKGNTFTFSEYLGLSWMCLRLYH